MINKWLDMLGLYDFLGVICPGIFAIGIGIVLFYINFDGNSISNQFDIPYKVIKYFVYAFSVVAIYVLGSFLHEIGHYFAHIYNVGFGEAIDQISWSIGKSKKALFGSGNNETEKLFLIYDFSNTNKFERQAWYELMKQVDFCRNNNEFAIVGELEDNIRDNYEEFTNRSAAFYQHCKRVISLKGVSTSSKKKESIYGFCRNISAIFGLAIMGVIGCIIVHLGNFAFIQIMNFTFDFFCIKNFGYYIRKIIEDDSLVKYILEIVCLLPLFVVFSAKSIRYKNMEVVDTIRTYRYLAENKNKYNKKHENKK